jgi:pimeloyl-ACP methyl ester carboxylesterase
VLVSVGGGVRVFFDVDGAQLVPDGPWVRERPTVVLLHSGPGFDHAGSKQQVGPWLAQRGQVVYVDLRGHGRSDRSTPEHWNVDTWADDLDALFERLGIERPLVAGHGFSSLVALRLAARRPDLLRGLLLVAPLARIVPERSVAVFERVGGPEAAEAGRRYWAAESDDAFVGFLSVCFPVLAGHARFSESMARSTWNPDVALHWLSTEARTLDVRPELEAVGVPVLALAGEDDAWSPLESAREVAEGLRNAPVRFRSFAGRRHSVFQNNPEAFAELESFLDGLDEREQAA